ncbi:MAG: C39 family peptidase [Methanophagales archaeon]|nr:C39 family peptidase [Methanophagales archaeon]
MKLKIPYFRQEKWFTCGPACLRMLLTFIGIEISEDEIERFLKAWSIFKNWMVTCKRKY